MSDIIREIEEELQADKFASFLKSFQTPILVGVTALIVGTGGLSFWNSHQTKLHEQQTASLITALDQKDIAGALIQIPADQKSSVAHLIEASHLAKTDITKAITLYDTTANDSSLPRDVRDRAILDKIWLQLRDTKQLKIDDAMAELKNIRSNKKSIFVAEANFLSGFLAQTIQKNNKDAKVFFDAVVNDISAPDSLKARAQSLSTIAP
jgi:hypothetical protein